GLALIIGMIQSKAVPKLVDGHPSKIDQRSLLRPTVRIPGKGCVKNGVSFFHRRAAKSQQSNRENPGVEIVTKNLGIEKRRYFVVTGGGGDGRIKNSRQA